MSLGAIWAFDEDGRLASRQPFPHDGILLVSSTIRASSTRVEARHRIRTCVRHALSQCLGLSPDAIAFISHPGHAPRLMINDWPEPGFSISHEAGCSLAAVHLHGAVGVDVMQVQDVPDWQAVAQDYLGADVTARLMSVPEAMRSTAFAKAWCEREALLKLHGLELGEWGQVVMLMGEGVEVHMGRGMVGVVAVVTAAHHPHKSSKRPFPKRVS
ncbi:4'-phosphopantetheinyl transferase superfamily protein [Pseudomonas syringae]|uniref:4'-phosphopantetheinyl transferase family protein n=1 Tax=Pseudomonas syringae TaxID=317 RepID=UPI001CA9DCDD|nr:4'-phosphopantetheinyl transferase superfamily protein [Pseudomonas syringae]MCI3943409.1 4'-phosphopantetheinyl transferase superfamily protein [Pseudomonas syringae]